MSLSERKKLLRGELRDALTSIEERQVQDSLIRDQLDKLIDELQPKRLGLYLALSDEIDLKSYLERPDFVKCLPRWIGNEFQERQMNFYQYDGEDDVEQTTYIGRHIQQVKKTSEVIPDVLIVPGLGFSKKRERLGRGKGYYDNYINRYKEKIITIGICYREQLKENLPLEDHDRLLDILITPDEVYRKEK